MFTVERNILKVKFAIYAHFLKNKILIIARKMKGGGVILVSVDFV